jgi:hypothetical protein
MDLLENNELTCPNKGCGDNFLSQKMLDRHLPTCPYRNRSATPTEAASPTTVTHNTKEAPMAMIHPPVRITSNTPPLVAKPAVMANPPAAAKPAAPAAPAPVKAAKQAAPAPAPVKAAKQPTPPAAAKKPEPIKAEPKPIAAPVAAPKPEPKKAAAEPVAKPSKPAPTPVPPPAKAEAPKVENKKEEIASDSEGTGDDLVNVGKGRKDALLKYREQHAKMTPREKLLKLFSGFENSIATRQGLVAEWDANFNNQLVVTKNSITDLIAQLTALPNDLRFSYKGKFQKPKVDLVVGDTVKIKALYAEQFTDQPEELEGEVKAVRGEGKTLRYQVEFKTGPNSTLRVGNLENRHLLLASSVDSDEGDLEGDGE